MKNIKILIGSIKSNEYRIFNMLKGCEIHRNYYLKLNKNHREITKHFHVVNRRLDIIYDFSRINYDGIDSIVRGIDSPDIISSNMTSYRGILIRSTSFKRESFEGYNRIDISILPIKMKGIDYEDYKDSCKR